MDNKNLNENKEDINYKIKNRESIAKISIAVIFFALLSYKIALSSFEFDFRGFNFSDLLSLLLAIFSIGLSVAFYFKATDTSNKFYDNTFKFTKDISEILGRIEAGFGERLRHLDEGYSGLREKFSGGFQVDAEEIENTKKELEKEKEKLEKERNEKNDILTNLMKKAKLSEAEKGDVLEKLKHKENEISNLSKELLFLKRELKNNERHIVSDYSPLVKNMVFEYLKMNEFEISTIVDAPTSYLKRNLKFDREKFPRIFYERFVKYGIMNEDGNFSTKGIELLKELACKL
jgi:hypothetical protein